MIRRLVLGLALLALGCACATCADSWEERMARQLDKKVAFELVDTKLSDACDFISALSGLNIILAPAVRQKNPALTLRVQDMDAGTAIKWFTVLTETYAEVMNHAIFITDKPSEDRAMQEDKDKIMKLAARYNLIVELPPGNMPLTNEEVVKIAMQIVEKDVGTVQDFPGPDVSLGTAAPTGMAIGKQ